MKLGFRPLLVLAFFALFITSIQAQDKPATPQATPPKIEPAKPADKMVRTTPFDGNVEFPEVDGWELSEKHKYPTAQLGYSVNYESPTGGRVTVYVYNGGRKSIPSSLTGVVVEEMDRAKNDIKAAVDAGAYESAKLRKSESITLGGIAGNLKILYTSFDLVARGNKLHSEIYLFPYQNYFVKIRATRTKANEKSPAITALFSEIDALFLK